MLADRLYIAIKKFGDLISVQPDRILFRVDLNFNVYIAVIEDDDFVTHGIPPGTIMPYVPVPLEVLAKS